MNPIIFFLVALGLSMDCFSVAISNSNVSGEVKPGIPLKAGLTFAISHFILLWLGYLIGSLFVSWMEGIELFVVFVILSSIGGKMIFDAYRRRPEAKVFDINSIRVILALSLATGMDAFLAGIVVAFMALPAWSASAILALIVFVFTFAGLAGGGRLGIGFSKKTAIFGGAFILIAGIWVLLDFFQ